MTTGLMAHVDVVVDRANTGMLTDTSDAAPVAGDPDKANEHGESTYVDTSETKTP